jgi:hypothetical protein
MPRFTSTQPLLAHPLPRFRSPHTRPIPHRQPVPAVRAAAPKWSCQWWGGASKPRLDAAHICAACNAHVSVFQFHVYTHPSPDPLLGPLANTLKHIKPRRSKLLLLRAGRRRDQGPSSSCHRRRKHPHQDVRGIRGQGYAIGDPGTSRPYMVPISVVVAAASRHCRQCTHCRHCRRCSHHETG